MKNRFFIVLFLLSLVLRGQTQSPLEHCFENRTVKGIYFDRFEVKSVVPTANGYRVFLILGRNAAVMTKSLIGTWSPRNKELERVVALGVVEFSNDFKLISEEVTFLKPKGIIAKDYYIQDKNSFIDNKTLAKKEDMAEDQSVWIAKYPDLVEKKEAVEAEEHPKVYYKSSLKTAFSSGTVKGFKCVEYTMLDSSTPKKKQSFLDRLLEDSEEAPKPKYSEKVLAEVDMEGYRGSVKGDSWCQQGDGIYTEKTGTYIAHLKHHIHTRAGMNTQNMEMELIAIDKKGVIINKTDILFKIPHELDHEKVLFSDEGDLSGLVHVYKQLYGFGFKKINPTPNKKARTCYHWDANGKLMGKVDFEAPAEDLEILKSDEIGGVVSLLCRSASAKSIYTLQFSGNELVDTKVYDSNNNIYKGFDFNKPGYNGDKFAVYVSEKMPDNTRYEVYKVKSESQANVTSPKIVSYYGYFIVKINEKGEILQSKSISRNSSSLKTEPMRFNIMATDENSMAFFTKDPKIDGKVDFGSYKLNFKTGELNKLFNDNNEIEYFHYMEDSKSLILIQDDKESKCKMIRKIKY